MNVRAGDGRPPLHPPHERIIRAFGASGVPEAVGGGRGAAWRVGNRVFKPAELSAAEIEWEAQILSTIRPERIRLVAPLRSASGSFIVEGWMVTAYVEAVHEPGLWLDIIDIGHRLNAALAGLPRPAFLDVRRTARDIGDRVAWDEEPVTPFLTHPHVGRLADLRAPLQAVPQVIHGDLTRNVLFAEGLAPAVIDFAAYFRPSALTSAIVVAEALLAEGAPDSLVTAIDGGPDAGQFLVRALLARSITTILERPDLADATAAQAFGHATDLARDLIRRQGGGG